MSGPIGLRLQAAVVVLLFLGSLSAVFVSSFQTLYLPHAEAEAQDQMREASRRLAEGVPEWGELNRATEGNFDNLNAKLRAVSARVLRDFPGVEAGFYVNDGKDRFAGYGFPNDGHGPPPPPKVGPSPPHGPPPGPPALRGDDPPHKETPFILIQAQNSLSLEPGDFQFDVRTVGPSRVAILTEPVGPDRPARLATWTLFRLSNPEDLGAQLSRYKLSTGLALGGIALAGTLALNLGRTLKRQRREQERLRDELRRSEHLAALGKLLAGVAHEVRNPLAGIRSTVQLWERMPETTHNPASRAAVVHAVDRLNEIVTRLLYFSRADGSERQPVDINQVLRGTLELLQAQAAAQTVTVECDLEQGLPSVPGSASALRQVFLNLATNALQAMPTGGWLRCSTSFPRAADTVEIVVEDTGEGIAPDDQRRVFEPFFTTRPEGTGLGLALCREIVVQHGGQIELASSNATGTTFRVQLPAGSSKLG